MAEKTGISWATHTWNPWLGCTKVHTGCVNCYAEKLGGRLGVTWGHGGTRRRTADSTWGQVERWHRRALNWEAACVVWNEVAKDSPMGHCVLHHERPRVFSSLCDWFEDWGGPILNATGEKLWRQWDSGAEVASEKRPSPRHSPLTMADVRYDAFAMIDRCPNLDFLIATKRPENAPGMWPIESCDGYGNRMPQSNRGFAGRLYRKNVWLGYSASDQATLDAGLPHLLACRDLVPVLWLSIEPLVGPVDIAPYIGGRSYCCLKCGKWANAETELIFFGGDDYMCDCGGRIEIGPTLDWVVVGGESGPDHRPCEIEWIESIVAQCKAAGVPCWVKQDCGVKPGKQGRIPDRLWNVKELPR